MGEGFCGKCCYETEMLLSDEDVKRIEELGFSREEFSIVVGGIRKLRNVDGRCFFLKNNMCSIYDHRPIGCRLYPAVFDGKEVVVDELCPKKGEVKLSDEAKRALLRLIKTIYGDEVKF